MLGIKKQQTMNMAMNEFGELMSVTIAEELLLLGRVVREK